MITASLVKELRDKTNAGMMDCKKVLTETNGDIEASIKLLRERGIAKAGAKADRAANEGIITARVNGDASPASCSRSTARPTSFPKTRTSRLRERNRRHPHRSERAPTTPPRFSREDGRI
jgi:hypothetical protein